MIPDTTSDRPQGLFEVRLTSGYADTVTKIVEFTRTQTKAAVWLVGTSQGTNAAANAATVLTHGEVAGLVLHLDSHTPGPSSGVERKRFRRKFEGYCRPHVDWREQR